jgi:prostaglandin-endoperoxide synthase 2
MPTVTATAKAVPFLLKLINEWPFARRFISGVVIDRTSTGSASRPGPYSLWTPPGSGGAIPAWAPRGGDPAVAAPAVREHAYASWPSLVDRRFTGRHLPPDRDRKLPPMQDVVALFRRLPGTYRPSTVNSALLTYFAQWFTDSFLRTDSRDLRSNTSNHEIDFCQVYGLDETRTRALREGRGGRLASRETATGEYLPLLLKDGAVDPRFAGFDYAQRIENGPLVVQAWMKQAGMTDAEIAANSPFLYATGLERGSSNIGYVACSVLFLREHNRLARAIEARHPTWSDDRIFETARNTLIVIGLKLVIEDYIVQLAQSPFRLQMDPGLAPRRPWYRTNRIAIEFNLLYRWHSMVPDVITMGGQPTPFHTLQFNNGLLETLGLESLVDRLSREPAGYLGLRNVPEFLMRAEEGAHRMSRAFALAPMNAYRRHFGLAPLTSFETLGPDAATRDALKTLYDNDIDAVEFLPGMFAEEERGDANFGSLLMRMVGFDAFTQALTNPLLAPQLFVKETFSEVGWEAIHETQSLDDMFRRNSRATAAQKASLGLG